MKRNLALGLLLSVVTFLAGAGNCRSQEAPAPPEPPDAPEFWQEAPEPPDPQGQKEALESELEDLKSVAGAWLGVTLKDVTAEKVRDLKLPGEYGALVESVDADSAAAKAGLEKGDVIVEFAGERVRSVAQLRRLIRETPAGRTVSLQVIRDGQTRTLSATLQARKNQFSFQTPEIQMPEIQIDPNLMGRLNRNFSFMFGGGRPSLGISGDELTTQLASYFGVKQGKGVLVREVEAGSPAAKAGLKAGDVIVAVDGKGVTTVAELRKALELKAGEEKRKLSVTIVRDHHEQIVPVELERPGLGEHEKEVAGFGVDAGEWQRVEAQLKEQMAEAQRNLQEAQKHLSDQQHLMLEKARQAAEAYRRAVEEQLRLQRRNQLGHPAGQSEAI
jgi:membrane-associated protease RseP (regulator of RpoE activity)